MIASSRILAIVMPSWLGDTVMATPVLRAGRALLPKTKIVAVLRPGLGEVLRGLPWLDDIVEVDSKGIGGAWRLGRAIRGTGADGVLLLPNSFKSALGARLSGAKTRIGYARDGRGWLLSDPVAVTAAKPSPPIPAVRSYAELAMQALGAPSIDQRLELAITDEQQAAGDEMLREVPGRFVILNPGANRPDKRWPAARFAMVADALAKRCTLAIVVNGSPGEREVIDAVKAAANTPIIDLSQRGVTLGSLKAVVKRAALMITNDTGPRHLAAALGTPMVTLFGPTDHRWTTLDCPQERLLLAEPFLPEGLVADRHAKSCAIDKISVGDVLNAAEELLTKPLAA